MSEQVLSGSKVDDVIGAVTRILYEVGAAKWKVADKGALLAAVKLSLLPLESNEKPKAGG